MSNWKEHCVADSEMNWVYLRTDGKRWQMRSEQAVPMDGSAQDLIDLLRSLIEEHDEVVMGTDLQDGSDGSVWMPVILCWNDIPADHENIQYVDEDLGARLDRRDRYLHRQRMKEPSYAKAYQGMIDKILAEHEAAYAKSKKAMDEAFAEADARLKAAEEQRAEEAKLEPLGGA